MKPTRFRVQSVRNPYFIEPHGEPSGEHDAQEGSVGCVKGCSVEGELLNVIYVFREGITEKCRRLHRFSEHGVRATYEIVADHTILIPVCRKQCILRLANMKEDQ